MGKSIIIGLAVLIAVFAIKPAYAQAPTEVFKPPTIQEMVQSYAKEYGVSASQMLGTMKCESNLNPNAVGDNGTSFGLVQIHLSAHPDVTKIEAFDPQYAVEFMAKEFSERNQSEWTCWRLLYGLQ